MRTNPVEIKHFELLQSLRMPRNDAEEWDLYTQLVTQHGMCPWLAAALYMSTVSRGLKPTILAYLQADHSAEAQYERRQFLEKTVYDVAAIIDTPYHNNALGVVRAWLFQRPSTLSDAEGRRQLVIRLYHWRSL